MWTRRRPRAPPRPPGPSPAGECAGGRRGPPSRGSWLLLLGGADLGEDVTAREDEQVLTVDGDLGAAVLRVEDHVADGHVDGDQLTGVLRATARARGDDLTLLGLLLGGVGDDEAAHGRLLGVAGADDDPVFERLQTHEGASCSCTELCRTVGKDAGEGLALAECEC